MYEEALEYYKKNYIPKYKYRTHLFFMRKNISNVKIYNSISNRIFIVDKELKEIENTIIKKYGFIIFKKIDKKT